MNGPVHFIYLGGPFRWQHWRAVETAKVHGSPIIVWFAATPEVMPGDHFNKLILDVDVDLRPLGMPDWLRDHPIQLANVKDLFAWEILRDHGGLYLDLDTISLNPVWDLREREVLVSTEWPDLTDPVARHPYNSAVVAGRKGSPILDVLRREALSLLAEGEAGWGACGPHLLTSVVSRYSEAFTAAPFPLLSGYRDDTVEAEYYNLVEHHMVPLIAPDVRVLHLYSSSRHDRFLADRWMP